MPFSLFNRRSHVPSESHELSTKREKYSVQEMESPKKPDNSPEIISGGVKGK